ncbi:MAG TPA: tyrosine-type recombinase/integrase [Solirubrobacterales bacterium]|nr:tyrosine-type recombinase/integrase [Solirubrobacterales bacterium]
MQILEARSRYVRWLLATKDLSPHTIRAYDGDLASFERHLGGGAPVAAIDRDELVSFLEVQREAGLSPASLRRRASALRGFCRWLSLEGLLATDPWSGTIVSPGRSRRLPRAMPAHELDRLITFLKGAAGSSGGRRDPGPVQERPHESTTLLAVALMVATGIRVHEAVGIRHQDVDLQSRGIRLVGKGRRERHVYLTNSWITGLTGSYIDARSTIGGSHPFLLFNVRHEPLSPAAMRSRLAKAASAAGLTRRITPHMLRHTAATQLIEAGVDIRYIQRLLGHASLSTTEIYTHVSDEALRRTVTDADVLGKLARVR